MKKELLLVSFLLIAFLSKAQMWCQPGAQWHYGYVAGVPMTNGYLIANYTNDSVINTITYKKIKVTRYGNFPWGSDDFRQILINENNKLVTLWNGNVDTLFNFNAAIGTKWLRVRWGDVNNDVTRRYVTVLDTGHVIINSITLKKLVLSYQSGGWPTAIVTNYTDTVYEKIGTINFFLNPAAIETSTFLTDVSGTKINGTFRCYSDNNFSLYQHLNTISCAAIVGIKEFEERSSLISIFPNPVINTIAITSNKYDLENSKIQIMNQIGQVVLAVNYSNAISVSNLTTGVYTVTIKLKNGELLNSKIIKE